MCLRAQIDLFGQGKLELADEVIAPDYLDHESLGDTPAGPEGARRIIEWLRGAFPDLAYDVHDVFGAGDRVALRCTTSGTHIGEFRGFPATGRRFAMEAIHIYRLEGGRIAEHWAVRNDLAMFSQLGIVQL
ncbi:MAG: ester cyclase [Chloroflexi bacterium]|nr:ester cyclase [Chloroflexota bacterium]